MKKIIIFCLSACFLLAPFYSFAANKKLCFSPKKANILVGQEFSVEVFVKNYVVNSADVEKAINAIDGEIIFSKNLLEVKRTSPDRNVLTYWLRNLEGYKIVNGKMRFTGVIFYPGFSGKKGRLFTVTFLAKAPGKATLKFKNSALYLNNGIATKAKHKKCKAEFVIKQSMGSMTK